MNHEYVSISDAARRLNISRMLLSRRVHNGDLPYFHDPLDSRKRLIRLVDLEALKRPRPANREQVTEVSAA